MTQNKQFVTRSEHAKENKRLAKINQLGRHLNIYIGIVAALTIIILAYTIMTNGTNEEAAKNNEEPAPTEQPVEKPAEEPTEEDAPIEESPIEAPPTTEPEVVTVDDPVVQEVHTNAAWAPHPTEQTGPHTSTFENGHIDYEEKLKAIFSVTDLVQEESFVKKVGNNGSASSAIAVVTSKDGAKMYRVSIEWLDGVGWKPVKLEVLKTLDGAY